MDILARLTAGAHVAALAIGHEAEVPALDKNFTRFTRIRYQILS